MLTRRAINLDVEWRPDKVAYDLWITTREFNPNVYDGPGSMSNCVVLPMDFKPIPRHGLVEVGKGPTLCLEKEMMHEFLQSAMDAAWNLGIRPSGVRDLESTLEATRYHLEDMRYLATTSKRDAKK